MDPFKAAGGNGRGGLRRGLEASCTCTIPYGFIWFYMVLFVFFNGFVCFCLMVLYVVYGFSMVANGFIMFYMVLLG